MLSTYRNIIPQGNRIILLMKLEKTLLKTEVKLMFVQCLNVMIYANLNKYTIYKSALTSTLQN